MNYVHVPNLPQSPVSLAVVDCRAGQKIISSLEALGVELIKAKIHPGVYEAISCHPDIMIHHIGRNRILYAPGTNIELLCSLSSHGFELIKGQTSLSGKYPGDIAYNAARIGNFAFHNLKYTDPVLKNELFKEEIELIHINQGYAKCSICIVSHNSIITSDVGIARIAEKHGIESFLLECDNGIVLPGLDYGFIGGSTGLLDKNKLAVAGDFYRLPAADNIEKFVNGKGINIISLSNEKIVDIGSIIPLLTK